MAPKQEEFEDKLGALIKEYIDAGMSIDEILSAIEVQRMAAEDEYGHDD